jgi:hypothetical protein
MFIACLGLVLSLGLLGSSSLGFWPSHTPSGIALDAIGGESGKATPSHRHPHGEWTEDHTATVRSAAVETGPKKAPTDHGVPEPAAAGEKAPGVTRPAPQPAPAPVSEPPGHEAHQTRVGRADVKTTGKAVVKTGRARGRIPGANPGHGGTPPGNALGHQKH